ncbi:MAG: hypothetical protein JW719_08455, partial [Pirellulales bacterium]|nr:hypothetical protein [Pirellulales bacterium]
MLHRDEPGGEDGKTSRSKPVATRKRRYKKSIPKGTIVLEILSTLRSRLLPKLKFLYGDRAEACFQA